MMMMMMVMMMMIDGDGDTMFYILQFKYAPIRYHPTFGCCSWVMTFLFYVVDDVDDNGDVDVDVDVDDDNDDDDDDDNDDNNDDNDDNDVSIVLLLYRKECYVDMILMGYVFCHTVSSLKQYTWEAANLIALV